VTFVLNTVGIPGGVPITGVNCQALYVDMTAPATIGATADAAGSAVTDWGAATGFPLDPTLYGLTFYSQAWWVDTVTQDLLLTNGNAHVVAPIPYYSASGPIDRKAVRSPGFPLAPNFGPSSAAIDNPILIYQ
jgi:hypothetical protein